MNTQPSPTRLYRCHVANLCALKRALDTTALATRAALAEENDVSIASFTRLYAFLVGAWAEARLQKLLNENEAFDATQKRDITAQRTQTDRWMKAIEVCFRKHFGITTAELKPPALPHSAFSRHQTLIGIVEQHLRPVIEVRNKLAHGQWIYPLNTDCTAVENTKYRLINQENLLSLQFKRSLVCSLTEILHDLAVSLSTFDRDFDDHYAHIVMTLENLKNRDFSDYKSSLIEKRRRGIARRRGTP